MEYEFLLKEIIEELGANYREGTEEIITNLLKRTYSIAIDCSKLTKKEERLYPYIKEAVISKYNRLGAEGMNSKSEGSQSHSFFDIEEKMRKDIISANLRRVL